MTRDIGQLTARTHDLLVVGGGIYGLTIACDAAQRGLSVALIDRSDFGSGSSFNHLRTIHGGLRYLQSLDIGRARESVRERRTLARIAPHAVQPLAFVLPLSRSLARGKLAMRAGFLLDRVVAPDRNRGIQRALHLPHGRVLSRQRLLDEFGGGQLPKGPGAAVWYDYVTPESDRLTFAWAIAAAENGAVLANYVEAEELLRDGGRVVGVRAKDRQSGQTIEIAAGTTVCATGGSDGALLSRAGVKAPTPLLKAMNLVTRRPAGNQAVGARTRSGRHLFLVPWRGRAILGTWESAELCEDGNATPTPDEVGDFLEEINEAFSTLELTTDDVTLVHRGAVPAAVSPDGRIALEGRDLIRDHSVDGLEGVFTVAGAKYTTARAVAERAIDAVVRKRHPGASRCRTAATPLPGADGDLAVSGATLLERHGSLLADSVPHLLAAYGSRCEQVLQSAASQPSLLERVSDHSPVIGVELVWAANHEMAVTLLDVVARRTPLGALGYPGEAAVLRAAGIVGATSGWSEERRRQEIASVRQFYAIS